MSNSEKPLGQASDNLMAYLRAELNDSKVSYDVSLTPMLGGYEAFTYHFKLKSVQSEFAKPLVLRLFREYRNADQAISESAVQNALAAQGYPAPSVLFTGTDKRHLGGVFLIMDFLPGENMLAAAGQDVSLMLGKAHAALHRISSTPLFNALREQGFEEQRFRLSGRMSGLSTKAKSLPWLGESVQWLIENRPPEPERLAICHGDFHPLNILVKDRKVTAVLDWPGFLIGDPIMDVAFTTVLITIAARQLLPRQDWDEILDKYLEAYKSETPLDVEHFDYYRMLRCVMALIDGAEGQEVWTSPSALRSLIKHVYDIAKIRIALPD